MGERGYRDFSTLPPLGRLPFTSSAGTPDGQAPNRLPPSPSPMTHRGSRWTDGRVESRHPPRCMSTSNPTFSTAGERITRLSRGGTWRFSIGSRRSPAPPNYHSSSTCRRGTTSDRDRRSPGRQHCSMRFFPGSMGLSSWPMTETRLELFNAPKVKWRKPDPPGRRLSWPLKRAAGIRRLPRTAAALCGRSIPCWGAGDKVSEIAMGSEAWPCTPTDIGKLFDESQGEVQ